MKTLYIKISIQFNTTLLGIGIYPTLCQILPLRAVSIFSKPVEHFSAFFSVFISACLANTKRPAVGPTCPQSLECLSLTSMRCGKICLV